MARMAVDPNEEWLDAARDVRGIVDATLHAFAARARNQATVTTRDDATDGRSGGPVLRLMDLQPSGSR